MRREEIRRENARALAKKIGGPAEFARKIGMSDSQVSQLIGETPIRNIGNTVAPRIEDAFEVPRGWLDIQHDSGAAIIDAREALVTPPPLLTENFTPLGEREIDIPQYIGIGGAMGEGVTLRDQPGEIHGWRVTQEWISKNIRSHTGAGNLCIVTGFGNSMQPLYNPGDPLILDRGVKSVESDATYFFRVGTEGFIKILQRIPGEGIRVISKNKDYETWTIKPEMDFEVFGQVLKAWCGTDV